MIRLVLPMVKNLEKMLDQLMESLMESLMEMRLVAQKDEHLEIAMDASWVEKKGGPMGKTRAEQMDSS